MVVDAEMEMFSVQVNMSQAGHVVKVRGDVDILTAGQLEVLLSQVIDGSPGDLIIDLTDTAMMGAAGAAAIASARKRLTDDRALILRRPAPLTRRVMEICQLDGPCLIED
ncbi:MAG TPA: STAS domain-containing protein [Acidimicrobiales bacterium]|jgi:anti-anti-sigma factor|nr:STAS domain-containing protein [Acidimicrobiales bacterium]